MEDTMHTIELQHEISPEQFETVRKLLKAIDIKVKKPEKTKMSEDEFYAMIDKARQGAFHRDTPELRQELFGNV